MARKTQQTNCDEVCPWCEAEVLVPGDRISLCPECGAPIRPCSMCTECTEDCPYGPEETYGLFAEDIMLGYVYRHTDDDGRFMAWQFIDKTPQDIVGGLLDDHGLFPRTSPAGMALARCTAHYISDGMNRDFVQHLLCDNADYYRRLECHPAVMAVCHALCTCPERPTGSYEPGQDNFSVQAVSPHGETWLVYDDVPLCQAYAENVGWRLDRPLSDVAAEMVDKTTALVDMEDWLEETAEVLGYRSVAQWAVCAPLPSPEELAERYLREGIEALPDCPEGAGPLQIVRLGAAE